MLTPLPTIDDDELATIAGALDATGAEVLVGTTVDLGGVVRSKLAPRRRLAEFHRAGLGAAPSWHVFCVDNAIAFTPELGVVGDLRLRADLPALRDLGDGLAWVPVEFHEQGGDLSPLCTRGRLRTQVADLGALGVQARVGCEVEFVLTAPDGEPLGGRPWNCYGLSAALDREAFLRDLLAASAAAGLDVEQCHAEYGDGQYEISFAPGDPVHAADAVVLARLVIGRTARRHGLAASFSPWPFAGGAGNGAHLHLSLHRDGAPLLSGGTGPHGLTGEGAAALAGILAGLPEVIGVLAGSAVSGARLRPGQWSGAYAAWGQENREAALRLCGVQAGHSNIEVKCVDPSANPYLAAAVVIGLAAEGIRQHRPLPAETTGNPADSPEPPPALPADQALALERLRASASARQILGPEIHAALLAVRSHEVSAYGTGEPADVARRLRFAWSA